MAQLLPMLPPHVSIANAYENGKDEEQQFIQNLALFFTGFFKVIIFSRWYSVLL